MTRNLSLQKTKKLQELARAEEHLNAKKILEHKGQPIVFGSEVSFIHKDSGYYLSGEKDSSASRNTGYKCILKKQYGMFSVFQLLSFYKSKKVGDSVNVNNSVIIRNVNNNCCLDFDPAQTVERIYPRFGLPEDPLRPDVLHVDPHCSLNTSYYSTEARIGWSFDRLKEQKLDPGNLAVPLPGSLLSPSRSFATGPQPEHQIRNSDPRSRRDQSRSPRAAGRAIE